MNNVNINTEQLSNEIDKIKNTYNKFEEIFNEIKKDTESLKEFWSTRTSESVFNSFEDFYVALENVKTTFKKDIDFLEKTVSTSYIEEDKGTNRLVDSNIAM